MSVKLPVCFPAKMSASSGYHHVGHIGNMVDKSLVISLVRAHIQSSEEYMSYVPSYTKVRLCMFHHVRLVGGITHNVTPPVPHLVAETVGSHWRRKAHAKRSIDALICVCKQLDMAPERPHAWPHVGRKRNRA